MIPFVQKRHALHFVLASSICLVGLLIYFLNQSSGLIVNSPPVYEEVFPIIEAESTVSIKSKDLRISTTQPLHEVRIVKYEESVDINGSASITKVFDIHPENNTNLDAAITFTYEESDLNGIAENDLMLYSSADKGKTWEPHPNAVIDPVNNSIYLEGIEHFSLWTAAAAPSFMTTDENVEMNQMVDAPLATANQPMMFSGNPGGVSSDLELWLKADEGLSVDGTNKVTLWADQSAGTNNADMVFGDPRKVDGELNFNPVVNFDGGDWIRFTSSPFVTSFTEAEAIVVTRDSWFTSCNCGMPYDFGGTSRGFHYTWGNGYIYQGSFTNDRIGFQAGTGQIADGKSGVSKITGQSVDVKQWNIFGTHSAPNNYGIQFNGEFKVQTGSNTPKFNLAGGREHIGAISGNTFRGDVAEILLFDKVLTTSDREKVNSYLGLKYGVTLHQDYIASDGSIFWDTDGAETVYSFEVAGIGRDDDSGLSQKQSQAANNSGDVTIYLGDQTAGLPTSNAENSDAFGADKTFMLWGNDNGTAGYVVDYTPNSFTTATDYLIMERVWTIKETGTVGTVTVRAPANAEHLLVHNSADFTSGSPTEIALVDDGNGNLVATVNFSDGDFFTFGNELQTPGGIAKKDNVNGIYFEFYDAESPFPHEAVNGNLIQSGYMSSFLHSDDIVLNEKWDNITLVLKTEIEVASAGTYDFRFYGIDDHGSITIDGNTIAFTSLYSNDDFNNAITLSAGRHDIEVRFSERGGGERSQVQWNGPDSGNTWVDVPDSILFTNVQLSSWHRADMGIDKNDGEIIDVWKDQGINAVDATTYPGHNPILINSDEAVTTNQNGLFNFNPSVYFTDDQLDGPDQINGFAWDRQNRTSFTVSSQTGAGQEIIFGYGRDGGNLAYYNASYQHDFLTAFWGNFHWADNNPFQTQGIQLGRSSYANQKTVATNNLNIHLNGVLEKTSTAYNVTTRFNDNEDFAIGNTPDAGFNNGYNGNIAEVIIYPWKLTDAEANQVETYLGLKYGIHLGHNYIASDGTVLWDTTGNNYHNDVFGIGRDDASVLIQRQSQPDQGYISIYNGDQSAGLPKINSDNTSGFGTDKTFTIVGSNGLDPSFATAYSPNTFTPDLDYFLMGRIWKVREINTVGQVTITAPEGAEHLFVSPNEDFSGTPTEILLSNDGNGVLFAVVDLNDGDYFTFGNESEAPGGVVNGLELWTLPTAMAYDSSNNNIITSVEDYSGNLVSDKTYGLFDLRNSDPRIVEGGINFNNDIEFDGNDYFRIGGTFSNAWTEGERFTVLAENQTGYNGGNGFVTDFGGITGGTHYTYSNRGIYNRLGSSERKAWVSNTGQNIESNGTHQGYTFDTRNYIIENSWSASNDWGSDVNANPTYRDNTNTVNFGMNWYHWGAVSGAIYHGNSPEIFFYSRKVTDVERLRINSYLAIKYGISLGSETNLVDYLDSKADTIWHAKANFQNNIAGIGKDNGSALDQRQSTSVNTNTSITIYLGEQLGGLPTTSDLNPNSFLNNRDFLVWGDNGENVRFQKPYTPNSFTPEGVYLLMNRTWTVEETGSVETVTVKAPKGSTYMIVHNSEDFSSGTPTEIALTEDDQGNLLATYDFTDGQYFTFGNESEAPGGVLQATANGLFYELYNDVNFSLENGIVGELMQTGYVNNLTESEDFVLNEIPDNFTIVYKGQLEITEAGTYDFQFIGIDNSGAVFIDDVLVEANQLPVVNPVSTTP